MVIFLGNSVGYVDDDVGQWLTIIKLIMMI